MLPLELLPIRRLISSLFLILAALSWSTNYRLFPTGHYNHALNPAAADLDLPTVIGQLKAGDSLLLAAGTYSVPYEQGAKNTLTLAAQGTASEPITVLVMHSGNPGEPRFATLDFSFPPMEWVQDSFGLHVTGNYWYIKGIAVTRAGYQGVYVTGSHNTFENCAFFENRNTGLEINKGGAHTTVIHCDAFRNYDPKKMGSMADGFGPKQTQGPGNRFLGCRAWENSDDGFDAYDSPDSVIFENCWAFRNGVDVWNYGGFSGNGNGFKMGGNGKRAKNRFTRCVAFANPLKGFDQNNNSGGIALYHNLAYKNGTNYGMSNPVNAGEQHILKNNISLGAENEISHALQARNSWNPGYAASESDFISLDTALAALPRLADGTLPVTSLFFLREGSPLIDAGEVVESNYVGKAPDIGPFEHAQSPATRVGWRAAGAAILPALRRPLPLIGGGYNILGIALPGDKKGIRNIKLN